MKKIIFALTLVLSLGLLAGCGAKEVENKVETPIVENTQETKETENTNEEATAPDETKTEDAEKAGDTEEAVTDETQTSEEQGVSPYDAEKQTTDVTLSIKETEITSETKQITLTYANTTAEKGYSYGKQPHLEVKVDDAWVLVPTLDVMWDAMAYAVAPNSTVEDVLDIEFNYGKLEAGEYRLVKQLFPDAADVEATFVVTEFEVK